MKIAMPAPSGSRVLLTAIRPRTLPLSIAPVAAAAALVYEQAGALHLPSLVAALAAALAIQAGTNLWNDLADGLRGGDRVGRLGPPRVTALGWAKPGQVRRWALAAFGLASVLGAGLAWRGGVPILALGIASLFCGWAYSAGPRPISATPFGEAFVIAFFGIGAVAGTAWLQALAWVPGSIELGLAMGLPAAAVLMVNNYRDMEPDRAGGRQTLAILVGSRASVVLYAVLMLGPFLLLRWIALLALPEAVRLIHAFATRPRGTGFNRILAHTARYQLLLAALFVLGIFVCPSR